MATSIDAEAARTPPACTVGIDAGPTAEPSRPRPPTIEPTVSVGTSGFAVGIGAAF